MLVYWIPQSPHTLPTNATHRVGIGAFLINQNREIYAFSISNAPAATITFISNVHIALLSFIFI